MIGVYLNLLGVLLLAIGAYLDLFHGGWRGKAIAFAGLMAILGVTVTGS